MKHFVLVCCVVVGVAQTAVAQESYVPVVGARVSCQDGVAAGFECSRVDLLSFLPIADIGGPTVQVGEVVRTVTLNDVWGWTDPQTGREYALVGRSDGTAIVDVTDPVNPLYVGIMPSHEILHPDTTTSAGKVLHEDKGVSSWRDIKVIDDHAVVVADASPDHGVQILDLTQLRDLSHTPVIFRETAHYDGIGSAHNVAVNEETGFVYAVGSSGGTGDACGGGLHMIDLADPLQPTFAGCFADKTTGIRRTGYTHDVQCVVYSGPDPDYAGREICVGSNETAISIADVTEKANPVAVSTASYAGAAYIHQGWFTPDQRYFLQDDELDESREGADQRTRTMIWDLEDLDAPKLLTVYEGTTGSIDHNQYVVGNVVFQANYKSGLRILDISDITSPREIAFFDTYPQSDDRGFDGAWSTYPFFASGTVLISSIREGLFVVDPFGLGLSREVPDRRASVMVGTAYPNPFQDRAQIDVRVTRPTTVRVEVFDVLGRSVELLHEGTMTPGNYVMSMSGEALPSGTYFVRVTTPSEQMVRAMVRAR